MDKQQKCHLCQGYIVNFGDGTVSHTEIECLRQRIINTEIQIREFSDKLNTWAKPT